MSKPFLSSKENESTPISSSIDENISLLKEVFDSCDDLVFRKTQINHQSACLVYFSEMINSNTLYEIDKGLSSFSSTQQTFNESTTTLIKRHFPFSCFDDDSQNMQSIIKRILSGEPVLLIDKIKHVYVFQTDSKTKERGENSENERTVLGPKESFVENIDSNLRLIRRRIKTPLLKTESVTIGERTETQISVVYVKGIADEKIVKEVHSRLADIDIDGVLESHYIQSMIRDAPKSPFPTVFKTERPDQVCGSLLDGKVAILIDGTPFALTVPTVFVEFLHSADDYYNGSLFATVTRWIRLLGLFVALILPAFYVALTSFHQDLLQTPFLLRIAANREALPYPVLVEGIFMLLAYEMIREAGIRMPKIFGGAIVTILGLVIIGQITVQAGLVGPLMAIVISVSVLIAFILPNYDFHQVIRYCGIPLLLLAGFFGFMGIIVGLMFGLAHLVSIRSFGVPYFSPVSPARKEGWKDVFIRAPWWAMDSRPPGLGVENFGRAGKDNIANPPNKGKEDSRGE